MLIFQGVRVVVLDRCLFWGKDTPPEEKYRMKHRPFLLGGILKNPEPKDRDFRAPGHGDLKISREESHSNFSGCHPQRTNIS